LNFAKLSRSLQETLWKNKEESLSNSEVTLSFGLFESKQVLHDRGGGGGGGGGSVCGIGGTMWLGLGGRGGGGEQSAIVVVVVRVIDI
jgi:hypothetical protein